MYNHFYGLAEAPFNITPDSKYLFLSRRHEEAMSSLAFGVTERKGFICLSGEIGSGKTTLIRSLLAELDRKSTRVAVILNSYLNDLELLKTINEEFGLPAKSDSKKELLDTLNAFLVEQFGLGHNVLLILDEAQNLEPRTLEQIRMISNLETETDKLIQIVLVGQPELRRTLALPQLEQLNQRITVRYHISPLNEDEVLKYIVHRLRVARAQIAIEWTRQSIRLIFHHTRGIPRRINVLCDRCLLIGYVNGSYTIDGQIVQKAVEEIRGESTSAAEDAPKTTVKRPKRAVGERVGQFALAVLLIGIVGGGVWFGARLKRMHPRIESGLLEPIQATEQRRNFFEEPRAAAMPPEAAAPRDESAKPTDTPAGETEASIEPTPAAAPDSTPAATPRAISIDPVAPGGASDSAPERTVAASDARPTSATVMLPAWTFDEHRVVRAHRPDHAEPAAFLTLLSLWRVEIELDAFAGAPPDRVARYDMPAMVRQLEFETYDTPSLTEALKFDLPVLLRLGEDPGGGPAGAVTVLRMEGDLLTVADPLRGRRTVKRSEIEPRVRRAFVVYRDPHRWNSLTRGAEGPVVESLQRALQGLSLDVGPIDGKFGAKLADALGEFQRLHRLPVVLDRIAPMTAAMLCTLYDDHRPRLYS